MLYLLQENINKRGGKMAGYCSARKLTNVKGRLDYISNPARQEYIEGYYNTADYSFWELLADESQQQFAKKVNRKGKCCEAREFIIAIPQDYQITSREIAEWFKATYGVECAVALHWKESTQNFHAHLIYAERTLLPEPERIEHKRAYYYDAEGKKCKKADAVRCVPKGVETRYFTGKNKMFESTSFALSFKNTILDYFGLDRFDSTRHFATKHIGKGNPKAEYIEAYNNLVGDLNAYFDLFEEINGLEELNGSTPKQVFCERLKCYDMDEIEQEFAKFKELYPISKKTAQKRFESLLEHKDEIETDLNRAEELLKGKPKDLLERQLYDIHKSELTSKYNEQGLDLVELLKELLQTVISKIKGFINTTKQFNIDLSGGSALERIKTNDEINLD